MSGLKMNEWMNCHAQLDLEFVKYDWMLLVKIQHGWKLFK